MKFNLKKSLFFSMLGIFFSNTFCAADENFNLEDDQFDEEEFADAQYDLVQALNRRQERYNIALCEAAAKGNIEEMKILLDKGAKINVNEGPSPLHVACQRGQTNAVEFLLKEKADINLTNFGNENALYSAVKSKNCELIKLLINSKCTVQNIATTGSGKQYSIIDFSCHLVNNFKIINLLIENNADVEGYIGNERNPNKYGKESPFSRAFELGYYKSAQALITQGISISRAKNDKLFSDNLEMILPPLNKAKSDFEESLSMLPLPLRKLIAQYFGTNSYLECEI